MVATARRIEPAAAMERSGEAAWQGLSVDDAAAASSIAFRPMRRRPKAPDDLTEYREPDRITEDPGRRRHASCRRRQSRLPDQR